MYHNLFLFPGVKRILHGSLSPRSNSFVSPNSSSSVSYEQFISGLHWSALWRSFRRSINWLQQTTVLVEMTVLVEFKGLTIFSTKTVVCCICPSFLKAWSLISAVFFTRFAETLSFVLEFWVFSLSFEFFHPWVFLARSKKKPDLVTAFLY